MTSDCASVMFSYINIYGKYPPGLFANQCKEGKQGLDCANVEAPPPAPNAAFMVAPQALLLMATAAFMLLFFHI